jgi:hypothetical protein
MDERTNIQQPNNLAETKQFEKDNLTPAELIASMFREKGRGDQDAKSAYLEQPGHTEESYADFVNRHALKAGESFTKLEEEKKKSDPLAVVLGVIKNAGLKSFEPKENSTEDPASIIMQWKEDIRKKLEVARLSNTENLSDSALLDDLIKKQFKVSPSLGNYQLFGWEFGGSKSLRIEDYLPLCEAFGLLPSGASAEVNGKLSDMPNNDFIKMLKANNSGCTETNARIPSGGAMTEGFRIDVPIPSAEGLSLTFAAENDERYSAKVTGRGYPHLPQMAINFTPEALLRMLAVPKSE